LSQALVVSSLGRLKPGRLALHAAPANQHTVLYDRSIAPLADPDALPAPRSRYPTPARDPGADKERYGCEGEAVKPMEPMETRKTEATPDEGTSSDETVRSNEGARSDESAAHADAGSTEATATVKAAAEATHASIRGRRRRHCTNEGNGCGGNHDLAPHDLSSCPFSGDLVAKSLLYENEHWGADVQRHTNFSESVSDKKVSIVLAVGLVRAPVIMEVNNRPDTPCHPAH